MIELPVVLDEWSNSKTGLVCKLRATKISFIWARPDHL